MSAVDVFGRLKKKLTPVPGQLRDTWFWARRLSPVVQVGFVMSFIVALSASVALLTVEPQKLDIATQDVDVYELLSSTAVDLRVDFEGAAVRMPAGIVKRLVSSSTEGVRGTISMQAPSGRCLGFTIDVPLTADSGTLGRPTVSDVTDQPEEACRP